MAIEIKTLGWRRYTSSPTPSTFFDTAYQYRKALWTVSYPFDVKGEVEKLAKMYRLDLNELKKLNGINE